jgi:hypothetical protein
LPANVDRISSAIYQFRVAATQSSPTEDTGATPLPTQPAAAEVKESPRSFLRAARKDLTEEEASSPAGVRWLQYDTERLEEERAALNAELKETKEEYTKLQEIYFESRIELEKLRGQNLKLSRNDVLSTLCIGAGGAGLGAVPGYFEVSGAQHLAYVGAVISAVLLLGGIALRKWS